MIKTEFIVKSIQAANKTRTLAQLFGLAHEGSRPTGLYRKFPTEI